MTWHSGLLHLHLPHMVVLSDPEACQIKKARVVWSIINVYLLEGMSSGGTKVVIILIKKLGLFLSQRHYNTVYQLKLPNNSTGDDNRRQQLKRSLL